MLELHGFGASHQSMRLPTNTDLHHVITQWWTEYDIIIYAHHNYHYQGNGCFCGLDSAFQDVTTQASVCS